jgi:hypothetical protein
MKGSCVVFSKYSLGDIEFEVPGTWSVSEIEGAIEILDPQRQGALHLSILKRAKADALCELDARILVDNFAANNGLIAETPATAKVRASEARVTGCFRPSQPTEETPLHWLVASVVWPHRAVRVSYCTDSISAESLKLAAAIIDSIRSKNS